MKTRWKKCITDINALDLNCVNNHIIFNSLNTPVKRQNAQAWERAGSNLMWFSRNLFENKDIDWLYIMDGKDI